MSSWWRQSITLGYERARGKRAVGQTADAGFHLGVQRTVASTGAQAFELVTSRPELWLGKDASIAFEPGELYELPARNGAPGVSGEVRVVKPGDRSADDVAAGGLAGAGDASDHVHQIGSPTDAIHLHLEKLPDAEAREAMRERWREAMDRVAEGGCLIRALSPAGPAPREATRRLPCAPRAGAASLRAPRTESRIRS